MSNNFRADSEDEIFNNIYSNGFNGQYFLSGVFTGATGAGNSFVPFNYTFNPSGTIPVVVTANAKGITGSSLGVSILSTSITGFNYIISTGSTGAINWLAFGPSS